MMLTGGKLLILALVIFLLFKGKDIPKILGELGKGVTQFRKGLNAPPTDKQIAP